MLCQCDKTWRPTTLCRERSNTPLPHPSSSDCCPALCSRNTDFRHAKSPLFKTTGSLVAIDVHQWDSRISLISLRCVLTSPWWGRGTVLMLRSCASPCRRHCSLPLPRGSTGSWPWCHTRHRCLGAICPPANLAATSPLHSAGESELKEQDSYKYLCTKTCAWNSKKISS